MRHRLEVAFGALALVMACGGDNSVDPKIVGAPHGGSGGASPGAGGAGAGMPGNGGATAAGAGEVTFGGASMSGGAHSTSMGGTVGTAGAATAGRAAGTAGTTSAGGRAGATGMGGRAGATGMGGRAGAASGGSSGSGGASTGGGNGGDVQLPPANGSYDYQIGGAYTPPSGVKVVSRDRGDAPAPGLYNICYVNGFQAQQADDAWWLSQHPDLILRDSQGNPVVDPDWDEMLLDTSTPQKRQGLADIVGGWIKGCATDGFDAVEVDNLDSYSRSGARLSQSNNVAFMKLLSDMGHQAGLAMGQKNSTELLSSRSAMGTDFAVAEECNRYSECGDYTAVYGDLVFVIEYRDQDFNAGCQNFPELSIVRRDVNVSTPSSGSYVYKGC